LAIPQIWNSVIFQIRHLKIWKLDIFKFQIWNSANFQILDSKFSNFKFEI
jgi:hypothetical protein